MIPWHKNRGPITNVNDDNHLLPHPYYIGFIIRKHAGGKLGNYANSGHAYLALLEPITSATVSDNRVFFKQTASIGMLLTDFGQSNKHLPEIFFVNNEHDKKDEKTHGINIGFLPASPAQYKRFIAIQRFLLEHQKKSVDLNQVSIFFKKPDGLIYNLQGKEISLKQLSLPFSFVIDVQPTINKQTKTHTYTLYYKDKSIGQSTYAYSSAKLKEKITTLINDFRDHLVSKQEKIIETIEKDNHYGSLKSSLDGYFCLFSQFSELESNETSTLNSENVLSEEDKKRLINEIPLFDQKGGLLSLIQGGKNTCFSIIDPVLKTVYQDNKTHAQRIGSTTRDNTFWFSSPKNPAVTFKDKLYCSSQQKKTITFLEDNNTAYRLTYQEINLYDEYEDDFVLDYEWFLIPPYETNANEQKAGMPEEFEKYKISKKNHPTLFKFLKKNVDSIKDAMSASKFSNKENDKEVQKYIRIIEKFVSIDERVDAKNIVQEDDKTKKERSYDLLKEVEESMADIHTDVNKSSAIVQKAEEIYNKCLFAAKYIEASYQSRLTHDKKNHKQEKYTAKIEFANKIKELIKTKGNTGEKLIDAKEIRKLKTELNAKGYHWSKLLTRLIEVIEIEEQQHEKQLNKLQKLLLNDLAYLKRASKVFQKAKDKLVDLQTNDLNWEYIYNAGKYNNVINPHDDENKRLMEDANKVISDKFSSPDKLQNMIAKINENLQRLAEKIFSKGENLSQIAETLAKNNHSGCSDNHFSFFSSSHGDEDDLIRVDIKGVQKQFK